MSWGTCYSATNNIHSELPPLMNDGRIYTNFDTSCKINKTMVDTYGIKSNIQYRQFLVNNGEALMIDNNVRACDQTGRCRFSNPGYEDMNKYGKYLFRSCRDPVQPYGYETSDLKNMYLSRQALQSKLVAPLMSQQGYLLDRTK